MNATDGMRIIEVGQGKPQFTITTCLHGDETCGRVAVNRLLSYAQSFEAPFFSKPVRFIVANEKARVKGKRYIEEDLNRLFPGDRESSIYEERLAAALMDVIEDTKVLDLHSTVSYDKPVANVHEWDATAQELACSTGLRRVVATTREFFTDAIIAHADAVTVECGLKGRPSAVANAHSIIRSFLSFYDVLPSVMDRPDPELFEMTGVVRKSGKGEQEYEFLAENFERVDEGEPFATEGGAMMRATEPFYPILMSANGYDNILGYKGQKIGPTKEVDLEESQAAD